MLASSYELETPVMYTALAVEGNLTEVVKKTANSSIHVSGITGAELMVDAREVVVNALEDFTDALGDVADT